MHLTLKRKCKKGNNMKKIYGGEVKLVVYTSVEACDDLTVERNKAHEVCDTEFFNDLRKLMEKYGFYTKLTSADLYQVEDVSKAELSLVDTYKQKAIEQQKRSKLRIQF